jgi:uncharacterized protein (DUF58 family)
MPFGLPHHIILRNYPREDGFTTIELRGHFPVAAFLVLFLWYLLSMTDEAAMGAAALGGLLLAAFLWARTMARHVTANRTLRYTAMQVGDELEERINLNNNSSLPVLWAEFVDRSELPAYNITSVRATEGYGSRKWTARALCTQRGFFRLGPWELRLGDPFGIFLVRHTFTQLQEILVYPPLAVLPPDLLPHAGSMGEHRPLRQPLLTETIDVITTRPYLPGDPLRRIHWPTTARQGEPYIKGFEPEATSTVWLILDFDADAHLGIGKDSTEETLVILAASLARDMLHRQLTVGLLAFTERPTVVLPKRGQSHLWPILRALAPLHPTSTQPLWQTLMHAKSLLSPRHLAFVITPSLDLTWVRSIKQLTRHSGTNIKTILLDPASFGGKGQAQVCATRLVEMGVSARVVRREEIRPLDAVYGELRRWEFKTLATGRVVTMQRPREASIVYNRSGG